MSTAYISHPACALHLMEPDHPESPRRLEAIEHHLKKDFLFDFLRHCEAPRATVEQLVHAHTRRHVEDILENAPEGDQRIQIDPDTWMNAHTPEAALRAAGAVVSAVDRVMAGEVGNAFCNVRPPGHHAERDRAMGFCFFNNIAVGARHALGQQGLQRVAIVDFDVHFGNGTADIFAGEDAVMLCSSYQYPLYPLASDPPGDARQINIPLPPGSGSAAFREAVLAVWVPALRRFRPQMLFFSAGFDAHYADPLAALRLREDDYAWVTRELMAQTAEFTNGRVVSALEGGYDLDALGRSAAAHVRALMGL